MTGNVRLGEFWEVVGSVFSRRWGRYYMDSLEFTSSSSSNDGGLEGCLVVPIRLKAPVFVRNLMRARMPSLVPRMVWRDIVGEVFSFVVAWQVLLSVGGPFSEILQCSLPLWAILDRGTGKTPWYKWIDDGSDIPGLPWKPFLRLPCLCPHHEYCMSFDVPNLCQVPKMIRVLFL